MACRYRLLSHHQPFSINRDSFAASAVVVVVLKIKGRKKNMEQGLLPIGSVVLLTNSTKRIMIIGVYQKQKNVEEEKIWDYIGCFYPEGYMGGNQTYLFDNSQIERVYALGYQDEEYFAFKVKLDEAIKQLRR